jgi:transposase
LIQHAGWNWRLVCMARCYSQDLRERVIDAVELEGMSCRGAAERFGVSESTAIKWLQRLHRTGVRTTLGTGGHRPSVIKPHRDLIEVALAKKSDITLQALCDQLLAERGIKADTSMMSRFLRSEGITHKKRPWSHMNRTART